MRYSIVIAALLGLITAKDLEAQQMVQADSMEGVDSAPDIDNTENVEVKDDQ